jgi:hypothetical protein
MAKIKGKLIKGNRISLLAYSKRTLKKSGGDGYTDILEIENIWGKQLKHRAELEKERK